MSNLRKFLSNAALMALSALAMRSIAVSFSVYVSSKAGAEAMGLFSLIMSVFGFALTVATSGIGLAVTRTVSEAVGVGDLGLARKYMRKCTLLCLVFGCGAAAVLFVFAKPIGEKILGDARTVYPLMILAPSLPFISLTTAYGGYFTAVKRVYKSAVYQVLEQLIKIGFTVWFFLIMLEKGAEYACIALVGADVISEVSACLISFLLFKTDRSISGKSLSPLPSSVVMRQICAIALPVALGTYVRSGLLTVEHILIPRNLRKSGLTQDMALAGYGMVHSMAFPTVLYPTAILSAFGSLLIPELAASAVRGEKNHIKYVTVRALQFSLIFSMGAAAVMLCFSGELGRLLYDSEEVSSYIRQIAPLIPIMYLDGVTDSILKGLGEQVFTMNVNILDTLLSVILVIILLPAKGISGYILMVYVTEIINFTLSFMRLLDVTKIKLPIGRMVVSPLLSAAGAVALSRLAFTLLHPPFSVRMQVILCSVLAILIYLIFVRLTGVIDREDMRWLRGIFKGEKKEKEKEKTRNSRRIYAQ